MSSRMEQEILQSLMAGAWGKTEQIAFSLDDSFMDVRDDVLKMARFWQKRIPLLSYKDSSSGKVLFREWEDFVDFCQEQDVRSSHMFLAIKSFILGRVIDFLSRASRECDNTQREILVLLAYAFDECEQVGRAIETLNFILTKFPDDADYRVYSLLGDIYSLDREYMKKEYAVCYFNELFLQCTDKIDIDSIESPLITRLVQLVRADYFPEDKMCYWIPVYGYLFGGLTLRRRLEYEEYKKIQAKISAYERSFRGGENLEVTIPKLMNLYFWIFDYYVYQMRTPEGVKQIYERVLYLAAELCRLYSYEEVGKKIGLQAEKVLDAYLEETNIC
ncbi:MAG: hypothetical protein ACRC9L_03825 [Brevinema sp.]